MELELKPRQSDSRVDTLNLCTILLPVAVVTEAVAGTAVVVITAAIMIITAEAEVWDC